MRDYSFPTRGALVACNPTLYSHGSEPEDAHFSQPSHIENPEGVHIQCPGSELIAPRINVKKISRNWIVMVMTDVEGKQK